MSIGIYSKKIGAPHYGSRRFAEYLRKGLCNLGNEVSMDAVFEKTTAVIIFGLYSLNNEINKDFINYCNSINIKVIQRLDNIGPRNSDVRGALEYIYEHCDAVIFQTNFGKDLCENHFKSVNIYRKDLKHITILNGAEVYENFIRSRPTSSSVILLSSYVNYVGDRLITPQVTCGVILELLHHDIECEYNVLGSMKEELPNLEKLDYWDQVKSGVNFLRLRIENDYLDDIRMQSHILMQLRPDDVCPNTAIEAIRLGMPIIYCTQSGVGEIVGEGGIGLSKKDILKLDIVALAVKSIMFDYDNYSDKALDSFLNNTDIRIVSKKYNDFIGEICNEKFNS